MTNKLIVEFIGTFFLVLAIGCAVLSGASGVIPPLAIGAALMVMVYAGGHISGAHYNPAVTIAIFIRGRCAAGEVVPYIAAQIIGAVLAALTIGYLKPDAAVVAGSLDIPRALLVEFLFTFALAYVVLNVATAKATAGNSYYGLAIGSTVMAGAFSAGGISGGVFNPAVAIGITMMGLSTWPVIWVFFAANLAGALVAGILFKKLNPLDS